MRGGRRREEKICVERRGESGRREATREQWEMNIKQL